MFYRVTLLSYIGVGFRCDVFSVGGEEYRRDNTVRDCESTSLHSLLYIKGGLQSESIFLKPNEPALRQSYNVSILKPDKLVLRRFPDYVIACLLGPYNVIRGLQLEL